MLETKRLSKVLAFVLVVALCLGSGAAMTACGSSDMDADISMSISDEDLVGNRVTAPIDNEFFTANNIDFEYVNIERTEDFTGEYVKISGMKDEEIQNKINALIKKTVEDALDNKNPPPCRGAKISLKQYKKADGSLEPVSSNVGTEVAGNVNNVLSIEIYRNVYYGDINGEYNERAWFSEVIPLNIDLNTGGEIKLQDLFADNVNGLEYINRYVANLLKKYDYDNEDTFLYTDQFDTKLTNPFSGFDEDVHFVFNSATGGIFIFIDYKTPEFYLGDAGSSYGRIYIPYNENIGITEKFMSDESLFTDEELVYWIIAESNDSALLKTENNEETPEEVGDGVNIYTGLNYYENQDEDLISYARGIYEAFDKRDDYIADVKKCKEKYGDVFGYLRFDVDCINVGKFNCISTVLDEEIEGAIGEEWETYSYNSSTKYITLDPKTGKAMSVDDLFTTEKWEDLLCQAMLKNMEDIKGYLDEDFEWSKDTEEYIRAMIKEINGFKLAYNEIEFSFNTVPEADAADYIVTEADNLYNYASLVKYVPYKNIGCKNLTIFK